MKAQLRIGLAALVSMNIAVVNTAQAADWKVTFTVPFSATDLSPHVSKVEIGCAIMDGGGVTLGFTSVWASIAGGKYSGAPIAIPVTAKSEVTKPASWLCQVLRLEDLNGKTCTPGAGSSIPICVVKPGSPSSGPHNILIAQGKF